MMNSEIVSRSQEWPYKKRVLLHALVEHTAIVMFLCNERKHHKTNVYEKFAYDVIKGYKDGLSLVANKDNLMVADHSLDELIGRSVNNLVTEFLRDEKDDSAKSSSKSYFLITLSMAAKFIPEMPDSEVDSLLGDLKEMPDSVFMSPKIIEWSKDLHEMGMEALEEVMAEMEEESKGAFDIFDDLDDFPIEERIGHETYNRILKGFRTEDDEPSSIGTFFCPTLPFYNPSDPDVYYKRKMREPFKVIEKHKDDVREDDFWGLLTLLRSALHMAASQFDIDENENHSFYIAYNIVVEFTTGFSKGLPRQHYDANTVYRNKLNTLLEDAVHLMLFFLEDYDDDMVVKVHRRFRLLESKMKPVGFEPYGFELVYEYVESRLL